MLVVTFRDLTEAIIVGFALGGVLFIKRMSEHALIERGAAFARDDRPRAFVVDFAEVPFLGSTAAHAMQMLAQKLARYGGTLYLTGASIEVRRVLLAQGVREPLAHYRTDLAAAVAEAHRLAAT